MSIDNDLRLTRNLATNIAETGITIPDITCVIDSGKHKEMRYAYVACWDHLTTCRRFDEKRQISRLVETNVAKSNAAQRRGRSGRVQKGLCFHLFTKIRHDTQVSRLCAFICIRLMVPSWQTSLIRKSRD